MHVIFALLYTALSNHQPFKNRHQNYQSEFKLTTDNIFTILKFFNHIFLPALMAPQAFYFTEWLVLHPTPPSTSTLFKSNLSLPFLKSARRYDVTCSHSIFRTLALPDLKVYFSARPAEWIMLPHFYYAVTSCCLLFNYAWVEAVIKFSCLRFFIFLRAYAVHCVVFRRWCRWSHLSLSRWLSAGRLWDLFWFSLIITCNL